MKNLIIEDETDKIGEITVNTVLKKNKKIKKKYKSGFYLLSDISFFGDYLLRGFNVALKKGDGTWQTSYVDYGCDGDYRKKTLLKSEIKAVKTEELNEKISNAGVLVSVDCINGVKTKENTLKAIEKLLKLCSDDTATCVVSVLMPKIDCFPDNITALSERELDYFIESKMEQTEEVLFYCELMSLLRKIVAENDTNVKVIRFFNVYSYDKFHTPSIDIKGIIKEIFENKKIVVTDEDYKLNTSLIYIRSACSQALSLLAKGKKGNVYNAVTKQANSGIIKEAVYDNYSDMFPLEKKLSAHKEESISNFPDCLKLKRLKFKTPNDLNCGIKHLASFDYNTEYSNDENIEFYNGKIEQIQQLEIEVLKEIDRICKENDINYFLAGGTLLGAIRNGMPISWDDDLDIGMLREDFDKFRKICKNSLGERFSYSSWLNKSGSHYPIDKVRLKNTYFSTRFSAKNTFEDGIFVDILIYDRTSNNPFMRKLQTTLLAVMNALILIRWYNVPRRNFHYRFSVLFLPILRLIPFSLYHAVYEFLLKLYKKNTKAEFLIDGVGKKLKDPNLPIKGLTETVYVDFAGTKAPIPVDPKPYLEYAYGPNYMELPPFNKRKCPHNFARIDLGGYVFGETDNSFREVDLRGELYESEN